ncbi:MAG: hypothetical protein WD770_06540 [Actinomycetota bacterium]
MIWVACEEPLVQSVELLEVRGEFDGDADDVVLWAIQAQDGRKAFSEAEVGGTPPGFEETVAVRGRLPSDARLLALVSPTNDRSIRLSFRIDQLRPGAIFAAGGNLSEQEFRARAEDMCS